MPSPQFDNLVQMMKAARGQGLPTIPELRVGFESLGQMLTVDSPAEAASVDMGGVPGERVSIPDADPNKALLYLHGGGYCIGSVNTHRQVAARFSMATGATVFLADYRLAPEHPHPAALDDALIAYRWLLGQGFTGDRIAVAGDSAGGGLTVALQVALRDAGDPLPAASVPISPWCDLVDFGEVSPAALDLDYLRPEHLEVFTSSYCGDQDPKSPLISPVYADLSGLPPMLVQAGDHEVLFDMGKRLVAAAKDQGVEATLEAGDGMFHAWHIFTGMLPEADEAIERAAAFLRSHLS